MKKYIILLVILSITFFETRSQSIRIAPGATISNLKWSTTSGNDVYDDISIQPAAFVGVEYFNKGAFAISSNIGYHYKAGREKVYYTDNLGNFLGRSLVRTGIAPNTIAVNNVSHDWIYNTWLPYRDWETDRKSTRLNSSHSAKSRMPSSA